MADLKRVATLEREMSALKARVGANEETAVYSGSDQAEFGYEQPDRALSRRCEFAIFQPRSMLCRG